MSQMKKFLKIVSPCCGASVQYGVGGHLECSKCLQPVSFSNGSKAG